MLKTLWDGFDSCGLDSLIECDFRELISSVQYAAITTQVDAFELLKNISKTELCIIITLSCMRQTIKESTKHHGLYFRLLKTDDI